MARSRSPLRPRVHRDVSMQCLPDASEGDYVLVHAGIAISRIDPVEAESLLQALDELQLLEDDDVASIPHSD